jgi:hypothetical protein
MNNVRLLALAACAVFAAPSFAQTFSNNWSFVDAGTGQTVGGVISGLVNGNGLSADGLTITVTQSPYDVMLGTYALDFGAGAGYSGEQDTYSAANGVVTYANFLYSDEIGEFLHFGSNPQGGTFYPQLISYNTLENAYNYDVGVQFSAVATGVPEPVSWAMMVGGFGLTGAAMRRRRANVRFT